MWPEVYARFDGRADAHFFCADAADAHLRAAPAACDGASLCDEELLKAAKAQLLGGA